MKVEHEYKPVGLIAVYAVYYSVLIAFLISSFFPQYRLWGVNVWAYFPGWVPFALFIIGVAIPAALWLGYRHDGPHGNDNQPPHGDDRMYPILCACLILVFGAAFYLLRTRVHLLGDGYTVLSLLAEDNPLVKTRELGEALAHIWLKSFIGNGETAALLSFRIISISSGVVFLIAAALFARLLFQNTLDRILFLLGLASSGYMLLFFGYVENYSLFVLSVGVYSLMGLLVIKSRVNRWLILPPLALAAFFHILGVTLIPSTLYILLVDSRAGNWIRETTAKTKLLISFFIALVMLLLFYYYYSTYPFFRFAFIPLFENRFTVEGYTLLSLNHLLDYLNLLILLLPALPVLAVLLLFLPLKKIFRKREYRFLLILLVSTLGAVFFFDPKIGMPRDWDLFSFSSVPLAILGYYVILENRQLIKVYITVCILCITLGFLSLYSRIVAQVIPNISEVHFENYTSLDRLKNRNARDILRAFYGAHGRELEIQPKLDKLRQDFPEEKMLDEAIELMNRRAYGLAAAPLKRAVEMNPIYWNAWSVLGACYTNLNKYDSALTCLNIANGLNPYNATIFNNLAWAYFHKNDYQRAKKLWFKALERDSLVIGALAGLSRLYQAQGDQEKYFEHLSRVVRRDDAPADFVKHLGDYYLSRGEYEQAAEIYRLALKKGLDSSYIEQLMEKHPELRW